MTNPATGGADYIVDFVVKAQQVGSSDIFIGESKNVFSFLDEAPTAIALTSWATAAVCTIEYAATACNAVTNDSALTITFTTTGSVAVKYIII